MNCLETEITPLSPWLPILLTSVPRRLSGAYLKWICWNFQQLEDLAGVLPKPGHCHCKKRTEQEVALTCKGHGGVLPQGAQLLLTAGFTGDILGAGEVEHQQCEAGQQQGGSRGSQEHHGRPLCSPGSQRQAGGRPAMQITSPQAPSVMPTSPNFLQCGHQPHRFCLFACLSLEINLYFVYII